MGEVKTVSFFGNGWCEPGSCVYDAVQETGRLLAEQGIIVVTGAYGGVMEAAARGAKGGNGKTLGFIHGDNSSNEYIDYSIRSNDYLVKINGKPNYFQDADYAIRMSCLLTSDAYIYVAEGGIGTFLEFIAAICYGQKFGEYKQIAILLPDDVGYNRGLWRNEMIQQLVTWGLLPPQLEICIQVVLKPAYAIRWVSMPYSLWKYLEMQLPSTLSLTSLPIDAKISDGLQALEEQSEFEVVGNFDEDDFYRAISEYYEIKGYYLGKNRVDIRKYSDNRILNRLSVAYQKNKLSMHVSAL